MRFRLVVGRDHGELFRLGLVIVRMPFWTASIDLAVTYFFLGTTEIFYELSANGSLSLCA